MRDNKIISSFVANVTSMLQTAPVLKWANNQAIEVVYFVTVAVLQHDGILRAHQSPNHQIKNTTVKHSGSNKAYQMADTFIKRTFCSADSIMAYTSEKHTFSKKKKEGKRKKERERTQKQGQELEIKPVPVTYAMEPQDMQEH